MYHVTSRRRLALATGLLAVCVAGLAPQAKGEGSRRWNQAPVVAITTPVIGAILRPMVPLTIKATATDPDGSVTRVRFYVDGVSIGRDETAPYEQVWLFPQLGTHVLTAVAKDDRDATTMSAPVTVKVANNTPPAVSMTSPADGSSYTADPASIVLTANATDDRAVAKVEFFADAISVGVKSAPDVALHVCDPDGPLSANATTRPAIGRPSSSASWPERCAVPPLLIVVSPV